MKLRTCNIIGFSYFGNNWKATAEKIHYSREYFRLDRFPFCFVVYLRTITILSLLFQFSIINTITFVMVMKSGPRNTDLTPSIRKRSFASGEQDASETEGKSIVLDSKTSIPGRNFKLFGFGVS